jgi:hypothetical protein
VLGIQAENLMAAESRISDVDVATEMATLTRNQVLSQAGTFDAGPGELDPADGPDAAAVIRDAVSE